MKVVDQNIPAELYNQYVRTLGQAQVWKPGSDIRSLSKRDWYELIHRRSPPRGAPSKAQLKVRAAFLKCVDCFNKMPRTGGVVPPAVGYRSKEWWYAKSLDPPEQNWKRTEMVTWVGWEAEPFQLKDTNYVWHNANWFLKTDEQDFINFYNAMKPKYGYPWSASNNPDQIVTKMNQIVCDEIDYDHEGDMTVCYTPGQTAQAKKGVCDDQSALHYALTWRALKELAWTDDQINNRLACVIVDREDNRHMYNWWKSNAGGTKIIENTYNPGTSPKVIGDMKYWGDDHAKYLIQKFDKEGHFEPVWTYPEITLPLWYYNYFIKYSWAVFYDDDVPDWCKELPPPPVEWIEKAPQLNSEMWIHALAVFNNKLYGGTAVNGRLYEWNGTNAWVQKAPQLNGENYIYALAVFNNKLYGATAPNGRLYEWNGTNAWVQKAPQLNGELNILSLAVFNNKLYGGTANNGRLYEWNGTNAWVQKAPQLNGQYGIRSLIVFNNKLYGGTASGGRLFEWNGTNAWVQKAPQLGSIQHIYSLAVFCDKLYGGVGSDCELFEWNGTNAWVKVADTLFWEYNIHSLAVFNSKLYGSTGQNGKLLEWNGTDAWIERAPKLGDEYIIYSLAVFNNKLYGGTGAHGKLYVANP